MTLEQTINKATMFKRLAQASRKSGNHAQTITLIERAVETLEPERGRLDSVEKGAVSAENRALAEALADAYGSSGGIYRAAEQWEKSVKAYDKGEEIEQDKRFGFVNSYNLTQRFVARVLLEPKEWVYPDKKIEEVHFAKALSLATDIVASQTIGPRAGDVWAWADLGMLQLLRGDEKEADLAWEMLVRLARQPFVFDSTRSVISALLKRMEPFVDKKGADPRLVTAAESLKKARDTLTKA